MPSIMKVLFFSGAQVGRFASHSLRGLGVSSAVRWTPHCAVSIHPCWLSNAPEAGGPGRPDMNLGLTPSAMLCITNYVHLLGLVVSLLPTTVRQIGRPTSCVVTFVQGQLDHLTHTL